MRTLAIYELYNKIYKSFYRLDYIGRGVGYGNLVTMHDDYMQNNATYCELVGTFARVRGDLFTSDRECGAVWLLFEMLDLFAMTSIDEKAAKKLTKQFNRFIDKTGGGLIWKGAD